MKDIIESYLKDFTIEQFVSFIKGRSTINGYYVIDHEYFDTLNIVLKKENKVLELNIVIPEHFIIYCIYE